MKLEKQAGATSEIWQVFIRDSSITTGAGLTGLTNASASLTAYYHRDTDTTATVINLVTMTVGTFTSSGFKEIDSVNMGGWYQFCPPNAALAAGAKSCGFHLKGATNMAPLPIEVQLVAVNPDSATAFITGVNSLAPPTNWNLESIDGSGRVDIAKIAGTAQTARDIGASVLLSSGTGTGQLDFTSGVVKANLAQILGTALTETAGLLAAGFKQFFNIASPTSTMNTITAVTTTASVSGNVGGNVVGSVASVTARVTANADQLAGQTITAAAGVTFPTSVASPTNITAGTITTVTNLTNAPTNGDLTAAMKASVTAAVPTANANADALLDRADAIETGLTLRGSTRIALAALAGKVSGAGTGTETFRNAVADSKSRIVSTNDASGNRTAVTTDAT